MRNGLTPPESGVPAALVRDCDEVKATSGANPDVATPFESDVEVIQRYAVPDSELGGPENPAQRPLNRLLVPARAARRFVHVHVWLRFELMSTQCKTLSAHQRQSQN